MNKGLNVSNGDYIQFLGADDMLTDKEIIKEVAVNCCDERIVCLSAPIIVVDEKMVIKKGIIIMLIIIIL